LSIVGRRRIGITDRVFAADAYGSCVMRLRSLLPLLALAAFGSSVLPASAGIMIDPNTGQEIKARYRSAGLAASPVPRETVAAPGTYKAGTIVVNTTERRLYLVQGDGTALRYGIGVGRDGFTWVGKHKVTMKREWPDWRPPAAMLKRRPDLPRFMPGGPNNPLGARAMYLGSTIYRIHGSNEPQTIGQAVSSGCFRMTNEDVADLYNRVQVGTQVVVLR
jgi:lipoprotein-anchoring transpeptidase ErfK/SrfK